MEDHTDLTNLVVELPAPYAEDLPPVPLETAIACLRAARNGLLAECDWIMLPDVWESLSPDTKALWTAYRQTLRDLPETVEDPFDPVWPVKPA